MSSLRRHQRRLLFGGGVLISLLIVLTLTVALLSDLDRFHSAENHRFAEARSAVDDFLLQRDRAYAGNINGGDAMWTGQQAWLQRQGAPWAHRFIEQGGAVLVRADGPAAVPWLVLGLPGQPLPRTTLDAYLGLMVEHSAYTAATVTALRSSGPVTMYAYEPQGRLLAVAGVADEAHLLSALRVQTRAEAFARLLQAGQGARSVRPAAGPVESATAGGRLWSRFDANPISGQPSLVGVQTLAEGPVPFLHRVVFEPVENIKAGVDARQPGVFALITADGRTVLKSAAMHRDLTPVLISEVLRADRVDGQRRYVDGQFVVAGAVRGVDWFMVQRYGWREVWQAEGGRMLAQILAALTILSALWWLLLRLDRRVFRPALADASRVFESEALSRAIVDTSPVGLALIDPASGQALVENALAAQMAAHAVAEDAQPLYVSLAGRVRADAARSTQDFQWTAPGTEAPLRLQVSMALATYRERPVWVCALRDVTAQAELEQTLRDARRDAERAREAAESASRAKTAFVATMSHEIRTPLNGVLGHLELLGRSSMDAGQRQHLDRIRLSADALLGTISDVLDFSKIEAGQLDIDPVPFLLRPLVEQSALLFSAQAQRKGVKLYYAIDPELDGTLEADVHRIRQILNNLLGNAVKFTESGRIVVRAALLHRPPEDSPLLRLQVVDSGIGLGEDQLEQLFQPFQQGNASISRRYGGSGLGLALCQQLARLLGGSIRAESTLGVGSVFTLEVPVRSGIAPAALPSLQGRHVTLLSAAAEWRAEIGGLLQRWGAEVTVMEQPQPLFDVAPRSTLLLFGERRAWSPEEEATLAGQHERVIRAYPHGPHQPQQQDDGLHVSSYAADALLRALQGATHREDTEADPGPLRRLGQGRVLLVEDNVVNRELIQQQLEALGLAVDSAGDGREALEVWRSGEHMAVLTDINMPVMNGYELARALRLQSPSLPILAITATALASERERCREAGITDLLLKPLNLTTLSRALHRHLPAAVAPVAQVPSDQSGGAARVTLPERLRATFVESTQSDIARIQSARAEGDDATLQDRMHALKGVLMMIGERDLGARCGALEAKLHARETVDTPTLQGVLDELQALVDHHARTLPGG